MEGKTMPEANRTQLPAPLQGRRSWFVAVSGQNRERRPQEGGLRRVTRKNAVAGARG